MQIIFRLYSHRDICLYSNECTDIFVSCKHVSPLYVQTNENGCNTCIVSSERCPPKDWVVFHADTLRVLDMALSPQHP